MDAANNTVSPILCRFPTGFHTPLGVRRRPHPPTPAL